MVSGGYLIAEALQLSIGLEMKIIIYLFSSVMLIPFLWMPFLFHFSKKVLAARVLSVFGVCLSSANHNPTLLHFPLTLLCFCAAAGREVFQPQTDTNSYVHGLITDHVVIHVVLH